MNIEFLNLLAFKLIQMKDILNIKHFANSLNAKMATHLPYHFFFHTF